MNRKDFIKGSCGICIALGSGFLLSAVLDSCKTPLGVVKTVAENNIVKIPLSEFQTEHFKIVRVGNYNYDLAVEKLADGTFKVIVLMCTHAHHPLTKTGENYYCTLHGSRFDHEGNVLKGPAEKKLLHLTSAVGKENVLIKLPNT